MESKKTTKERLLNQVETLDSEREESGKAATLLLKQITSPLSYNLQSGGHIMEYHLKYYMSCS